MNHGIARIGILLLLGAMAALELPRARCALACSSEALYLRAQYKLVTGDPDAARELIRQALAKARQDSARDTACPVNAAHS